MLPSQLVAESFRAYPPDAKRLAIKQLELLKRLPLGFVPLLLRELIVYDWKFPAERRDIDRQFAYLSALAPEAFAKTIQSFAQLELAAGVERTDWVNQPAIFSERLTAHLWASHQIDAFRAAAIDYVEKSSAALPDGPLPVHRAGIVVIGRGVQNNEYRLFRKLQPHGTYFTRINPSKGWSVLTDAVAARAAAHPQSYAHWYIDGDESAPAPENIAVVSYAALSPARGALQARMQKIYEASVFDPEAFRTTMAQTKLDDIGLDNGGDPVLNRFQLSLLTEGSGTQVFSTTFVQWAAREALRRAQPVTMLVRFAPRQRENSMNELLAEVQRQPDLDPQGSLIDADMGAYYTWVNQQRLPESEGARFLVWFEDHSEGLAIGPGFDRGKRSEEPVELDRLIERIV